MTLQTGSCPFVPLCERDLIGPELSEAEQSQLLEHLSGGCEVCEERLEFHLSGQGPVDDPSAPERARLDLLLKGAMGNASTSIEAREEIVFSRLRERLRDAGSQQDRRLRRRHLRVIFYVCNVAAVFMLLVAYAGTAAAVGIKRRSAQELVTRTEIRSLGVAIKYYAAAHQGTLPRQGGPALVQALGTMRPDGRGPFFVFAASRLTANGNYLDEFGNRYAYRSDDARALIYSYGFNGKDEQGAGDDLGVWVVIPR